MSTDRTNKLFCSLQTQEKGPVQTSQSVTLLIPNFPISRHVRIKLFLNRLYFSYSIQHRLSESQSFLALLCRQTTLLHQPQSATVVFLPLLFCLSQHILSAELCMYMTSSTSHHAFMMPSVVLRNGNQCLSNSEKSLLNGHEIICPFTCRIFDWHPGLVITNKTVRSIQSSTSFCGHAFLSPGETPRNRIAGKSFYFLSTISPNSCVLSNPVAALQLL